MDFLSKHHWGWLLLGLICLGISPIDLNAQVFSPGDLIEAHKDLDSLRNCNDCHSSQSQVDDNKCLTCHTLIQKRMDTEHGYHGLNIEPDQNCSTCHKDHKGRKAEGVIWPQGTRDAFDHDLTGWELKGSHQDLECLDCHESQRIVDEAVLKYFEAHPNAHTFLGSATECAQCHFDEHRGQFEDMQCTDCHNEVDWKEAPGFDHDEAWLLEGAHQKVECMECHKPTVDEQFDSNTFPTPRANTFLHMSPVPHEQCIDCHIDPHEERLGNDCLSCHSVESWDDPFAGNRKEQLAFHNETNFPLEGAHRDVKCDTCHITQANGEKLLQPIASENCSDCHANAHPEVNWNQQAYNGTDYTDCAGCHTVEQFKPSTFTFADHAETDFQLEGAHGAIACDTCHLSGLGPKRAHSKPYYAKGYLAKKEISLWHLSTNKDLNTCESCHTTPHRDQFVEQSCSDCHSVETWYMADEFDHNTLTQYPLEDKHAEVECTLCHLTETDSQGSFTLYMPLEFDDCQSCHGDVHYGQFSEVEPGLACKTCHVTTGFDDLLFDHNNLEFSDWALNGAHEEASCEDCHADIHLTDDIEVQRFRPTPKACEICHEDVHEGEYRETSLLLADLGMSPMPDEDTSNMSSYDTSLWQKPAHWVDHTMGDATNCAACHQETSWQSLIFDHSTTGFPLKGQHANILCQSCHINGYEEPLPQDCMGCHIDPHQAMLGTECQDCHTETSFHASTMEQTQHAHTSFPLIGKHAIVACQDCHMDQGDPNFMAAPTDCFTCHASSMPVGEAGKLDHSTLSTNCSDCHTATGWDMVSFWQHDQCFPIHPGSNHWWIGCDTCHVEGLPTITNTCSDSGVGCIQCHGCEADEHDGVLGYECADRKCYQCHTDGGG